MPKPTNLFTQRVRDVVRQIPQGSTMTYKQVATAAGNEKAARAVARVMAQNYDPDIPCHRVIRSDGTMGGYNRGGEKVKQKILLQEASNKNHGH